MKNNTLQNQNLTPVEKFQNAEQLWFWFLYSKSIQNGFCHNRPGNNKPCEILDVETLITKLYLCGKLSDEQLNVMKKFGDKRRAPYQYVYHENKSAALWQSAMETLQKYAYEKGWLAD